MKSLITNILVLIAMILMIIVMYCGFVSQKQENARLSSNIDAMRSEMARGFSKDGKETATIKQQTLTKGELKEIIHDELKSLNIKERDVKQVIMTGSETKADIALVADTADTTRKEYSYSDQWLDLCVTEDSAHVLVRDSLLIANHAKTRRFLWWTWKRYSGKTTIKNYSPYTRITGMTSIDVEQ